MESVRLNRKYSSTFWWIIYTLPLLVLLILLIGNMVLFSKNYNDIYYEEIVEVQSSSGTNIVPGEYVEKLYFNTNLSIEEVYAVCDTLDFEEADGFYGYTIYSDDHIGLAIMDFRSFDPTESGLPADTDMGILIIAITDGAYSTVFNTSVLSEMMFGIDFFDGWVLDNIDINSTCDDDETINPSDSSKLVSTTPYSVGSTETYINKYPLIYGKVEEEVIISAPESTPIILDTKTIYFNTNLSVEEVSDFISYACSLEFATYLVRNFTEDKVDSIKYGHYNGAYYIRTDDYILFSSDSTYMDCGFVGFNPLYKNGFKFTFNDIEENKCLLFKDIIGSTPYEEDKVYTVVNYTTYTGYVVQHVSTTFDGFTLTPVKNALSSLFEKVGFNVSGFIADFVIVLFTWFIQMIFIHIFIDVIVMIPRMFHDFTERKWI